MTSSPLSSTRIIRILVGIIYFLSAGSCKKYEEGPAFSLLSKKSRVCNEWIVNEARQDPNYANVTSSYPSSWKFMKDGSFMKDNFESTWKFDNDKEMLTITSTYFWGFTVDSLKILRLKRNSMILYQLNTQTTLSFIPK